MQLGWMPGALLQDAKAALAAETEKRPAANAAAIATWPDLTAMNFMIDSSDLNQINLNSHLTSAENIKICSIVGPFMLIDAFKCV